MPETFPDEVSDALKDPRNDFGKYVLVRLLGRGGMGEVYKAWEKPLSRYVALKLLREVDEENLVRFEREARLAAALTHSNIAAIYELGRHEDKVFISMQFIEGQTLEKIAANMNLALRAVHSAAGALAYAHGKGIIHRDINPRNIMVDRDGAAFITDFGIARQKKQGSTVTQTGIVVGTPGYMSPEQAQGLPLDDSTDIYSLGATMYYVCTHSAPFLGDEAINIVLKVVNEEPMAVRRINPDVDRRLATIIEKAMEKDPARRYGSARELEEDLRRFLTNQPILAKRRNFVDRFYRRIQKRRGAWIAAAAAFALLAAGAGIFVTSRYWARKEDKRNLAYQLLPQLERVIAEFELDPQWDDKETAERTARFEAKMDEILRLQPNFSPVFVQQAHLEWLLGRREEAYRSLRRAVSLEKDNAQAFLDLGRFKLKEYISLKIQRTGASLLSPISGTTDLAPDTQEMAELLRDGLRDFDTFQKLAARQSGSRSFGAVDLAFAQAVRALVTGDRKATLERLKVAAGSAFVERDARLLTAVVACEAGKYDLIEPALADQSAPTRDYLEVRAYIAICLIFQQIKEATPDADQALVEDLARLMLVTSPKGLENALRLPEPIQMQLQPYFARARERMAQIRSQ
jgi:serine/threonine protein kinase